MARPKGPEQRIPVKMRVNIGLMDRLEQLAAEFRPENADGDHGRNAGRPASGL